MSSSQFYITLFVGILSLKIQKLPCLIASEIGKDTWLLFLMYIFVNNYVEKPENLDK